MPVLRNTLVYGLSKFARALIFVVMFKLYGIGYEADIFFVAYTIAGLPGGLASFTSELIVGELGGLSFRFVAAATVLTMLCVATVGEVMGNYPMLLLVPFASASVGSVVLSAHLASKGDFSTGPLTMVGTGLVTLVLTVLLQSMLGIPGVCIAISVGESLGCSVLLAKSGVVLSGGERDILVAAFKRQKLALSVVFVTPTLRLGAALLGTGWVSGVSYVTGVVITVGVIATAGYRITKGYRRGVERRSPL